MSVAFAQNVHYLNASTYFTTIIRENEREARYKLYRNLWSLDGEHHRVPPYRTEKIPLILLLCKKLAKLNKKHAPTKAGADADAPSKTFIFTHECNRRDFTLHIAWLWHDQCNKFYSTFKYNWRSNKLFLLNSTVIA